jgi:hypothetical protein
MQTEISIVDFCDENGKFPEYPTRKIVIKSEILDFNKTPIKHGYINLKCYDYDGYSYYLEKQPVVIVDEFVVITNGKFINRPKPDQKNKSTMSGGFGNVNRLAYQWSATIIKANSWANSSNILESDVVWSDSGIRPTNFDMYSYHTSHGDNISYKDDRLDYEIWESLNLNSILSKYLAKSDIRDYKLKDLGI